MPPVLEFLPEVIRSARGPVAERDFPMEDSAMLNLSCLFKLFVSITAENVSSPSCGFSVLFSDALDKKPGLATESLFTVSVASLKAEPRIAGDLCIGVPILVGIGDASSRVVP